MTPRVQRVRRVGHARPLQPTRGGCSFLEAVVAPEELVADRNCGDACDAFGQRLLGVGFESLLDVGPLNALLYLIRVEAHLASSFADVRVAFLFRATGYVFRRRTVGAAVLLALIPAALAIPALSALALVSSVCALVVAYEAIRHREPRLRVRHPELAA